MALFGMRIYWVVVSDIFYFLWFVALNKNKGSIQVRPLLFS